MSIKITIISKSAAKQQIRATDGNRNANSGDGNE